MLAEKNKCTGCAACSNVCSLEAIKMVADKTGFLYPEINKDLCVNCGKCNEICPIIFPIERNDTFVPKTYIFQYKDDNIRKESTSGGAFTAIAEEIINRNGVVFGASFDENWCVRHTYTESLEGLAQFRNSKYVQSEIRNTYSETKHFLDTGRWVCFSGTPCQIHGLINYLGKDHEKLITVDLICLAIPSPKVFKKYLELRKKQIPHIKKISFRNKDLGYSYPTMLIEGNNKSYRNGSESDEWLRLFLKKYSTRSSCGECSAQKQRCSDFTIYDCNNIYEKKPDIDDEKGTSNILIWSNKGYQLFSLFKNKHITFEDSSKQKHQSNKAVPKTSEIIDFDTFYDDLEKLPAEQFFHKYTPQTTKIKILSYGRMFSYKIGVYKKLRSIIRAKRKR